MQGQSQQFANPPHGGVTSSKANEPPMTAASSHILNRLSEMADLVHNATASLADHIGALGLPDKADAPDTVERDAPATVMAALDQLNAKIRQLRRQLDRLYL